MTCRHGRPVMPSVRVDRVIYFGADLLALQGARPRVVDPAVASSRVSRRPSHGGGGLPMASVA